MEVSAEFKILLKLPGKCRSTLIRALNFLNKGVEMLHVPSETIWRPDIVLYNK